MHRTRRFHASVITLSIAVTTSAVTARAQSAPSKGDVLSGAADTLWGQALAAMDNQDYIGACVKLERVVQLRPDGLGAKLKLAECYEAAGRLASAWAMYGVAEPLAEKANQAERQKKAHDRVEALKPKLAMLTIVVPDGVRTLPGIEITCDDKVVEVAQWGVPRPVDKGRQVIVVTASGMERGEQVEVIESDGVMRTVTIDQPARVKLPADEVKPPESRRSAAPAVVLGLLAAGGIGTGIGLRVLSASIRSQAVALGSAITTPPNYGWCVPQWLSYDQRCPALQNKIDAEARYYNIATGTFIAGGAAAAGTILYILWPSPRPKAAVLSAAHAVRLTPILGPTGSGLLVSGSF
jgi:hypothetical protein